MYRQFPLVETTPISDTYVSGISSMEEIAPGIRRMTLFTLRRNTFDNRMERVVVARLIMADHEIMISRDYVGRHMEMGDTSKFPSLIFPIDGH